MEILTTQPDTSKLFTAPAISEIANTTMRQNITPYRRSSAKAFLKLKYLILRTYV